MDTRLYFGRSGGQIDGKMKGLLLVMLVALSWGGTPQGPPEPECAAGGYWDNVVANLNEMFWTPFLERYGVVRYAQREYLIHQGLTDGLEHKPLPKSCEIMGVTAFLDVICVQQAARGWGRWPCRILASQAVQVAMATLDECPLQTMENDPLVPALNRTLQRRQHCYYATMALRCSYLQLYWVIPYTLAALVFAVPVLLALCGGFGVAACCSLRKRDPYQ